MASAVGSERNRRPKGYIEAGISSSSLVADPVLSITSQIHSFKKVSFSIPGPRNQDEKVYVLHGRVCILALWLEVRRGVGKSPKPTRSNPANLLQMNQPGML